MMHKASLKFKPVGQGCFYSGRIVDHQNKPVFNFVYDCGTDSDQSYIDEAIAVHPVKNGEELHLCIISHFHDDHVSGIPELLRNTVCRRLVIPYYPPQERLIAYLESDNRDDNYRQMLEDPYTYFSGEQFNVEEIIVIRGKEGSNGEPGVIAPVAPDAGNEERQNNRSEEIILSEDKFFTDHWQVSDDNTDLFNMIAIAHPGAKLSKVQTRKIPYQTRTPFWKFIFYCRHIKNGTDAAYKARCAELVEKIDKYFLFQKNISASSDFLFKDLFSRKHISKIKGFYIAIFGLSKLNETSLAVFHEPISKECLISPFYSFYKRWFWYWGNAAYGTLLTGDLDLETKEKLELFQDYYQHYTRLVQLFQIMHHGATRNWPFGVRISQLHEFPNYVINHGVGRKHHPEQKVLKYLRSFNPRNIMLNNEVTPISYNIDFRL